MSGYQENRLVWTGSDTGVDTSWTIIDLSHKGALEYYIDDIVLEFANISGMSTFDWYLSVDNAGSHLITPVQTSQTISTVASSVARYAKPVAKGRKADDRGNGLYLVIKGDAGTFDVTAFAEGARL